MKIPVKVTKLLKKYKRGVRLDLGCGGNKQEGFIGVDKRKLSNVDIIHDLEVFPYPFPDDSVSVILMSHVVEHIKPWLMIDLFNELWRITEVGGQLWISMPYGYSQGFLQDPTHCNPRNEATWTYFDPDCELYRIYRPRPWKIERNHWNPNGNMEVILGKRSEKFIGRFSSENKK
jgi:hypothetical protein